ncbi:MAG: sodium:proton antiporter [Planctomycetota bacterium]
MSFLLYLALVPALAFASQWLAYKTRLPGILVLLMMGLILGQFVNLEDLLSDLIGHPAEEAGARFLFPLVSLAVAIVMFEGGLSLKLSDLREAGGAALRLCTLGAMITMAGSAVAGHYVLGFDWRVSLLLGAILVVTGPTVIGPLLRQVQPSSRVSNTLKWEGIVIDPIGAVLAVLVFEIALNNPGQDGFYQGALLLIKTVAVGTFGGIACGILMSYTIKRFLMPDHLHGVGALGCAVLLFALCDSSAHESGLIAVTIFGVWLTNQRDLDIEHIIEFKEHLTTLLIGCLFILLASRIELSILAEIAIPGSLFLLVLILLIRPVSVFVSLLGSGLNWNEQAFIAALAPRGIVAAAVSSVFALELEQTGEIQVAGADQLATVTFLVIIGTVTVYGLLASPIARLLGLSDPNRNGVLIAGADGWVVQFATQLKNVGCRVLLIDTNYRKVTQARLAHLDAVCANIMNEHAREELMLSGIGHFVAMTQNDHVNSLAIRECRSMFGRSHTYQLTFKTDSRRGMTRNMMGRELFSKDLKYSRILEMFEEGMEFKTTRLSDEFQFEDFQTQYEQVFPLAAVDSDGKLTFVTSDNAFKPSTDQTVIALVKATEKTNAG